MEPAGTGRRLRHRGDTTDNDIVAIATAADVGRTNRARVLQTLADHGPLSRADLARMSRVPCGTMGSIVLGLLQSGWLQEEQLRPPADGIAKPSRPLWFGPRAGLSGALTVRAASAHAAVVNARGEILAHTEIPLANEPAGSETLDQLLFTATIPVLAPFRTELTGVGLALPAAVASESGEVMASTPLPGLVGTHLGFPQQ